MLLIEASFADASTGLLFRSIDPVATELQSENWMFDEHLLFIKNAGCMGTGR